MRLNLTTKRQLNVGILTNWQQNNIASSLQHHPRSILVQLSSADTLTRKHMDVPIRVYALDFRPIFHELNMCTYAYATKLQMDQLLTRQHWPPVIEQSTCLPMNHMIIEKGEDFATNEKYTSSIILDRINKLINKKQRY